MSPEPDTGALLNAELRTLNLSLPPTRQQRLVTYAAELERWNQRINLTALRGQELIRRLIVEPIWIGHRLQLSGVLADVGSGNGSPGIPLAISHSMSRVYLIEARQKRAAFLRHVAGTLHLEEIFVYRNRLDQIEDVIDLPNWITIQAVAPNPRLLWSLRSFALPTTKIVWITSRKVSSPLAAERLVVPGSDTEIRIFGVDQF